VLQFQYESNQHEVCYPHEGVVSQSKGSSSSRLGDEEEFDVIADAIITIKSSINTFRARSLRTHAPRPPVLDHGALSDRDANPGCTELARKASTSSGGTVIFFFFFFFIPTSPAVSGRRVGRLCRL
jgi:hypothetical protein